jgi:hypothetical protein
MKTTIEVDKFETMYVAAIQSLGEEFARATAAISGNNLNSLEHGIAAQQTLCAQLTILQRSCDFTKLSPAARVAIKAALRKMQQDKQVFAALLEISGRSHRIMLAVCRAYRSVETHSGQPFGRKLSCEV